MIAGLGVHEAPWQPRDRGAAVGTESRKRSLISAPCKTLAAMESCREVFSPWDVGTVSICYRNPMLVYPML